MKTCIIIGLCLPLLSQAQQKQTGTSFEIKGTTNTKGALNDLIYLRYEQNGVKKLDSVRIKNNHYQFKGTLAYPVEASLSFGVPKDTAEHYRVTRFTKPYEFTFYLDAGKMLVKTEKEMYSSKISGSAAQADQDLLEQQLKPVYDKSEVHYRTNVAPAYERKDSAAIARVTEQSYRYDDEATQLRWQFIEQHPGSGIVLDQLQELTRSFLDPTRVSPIFNRMSPALQSSNAGKAYAQRLEKAKQTAPGTPAPDFTLNNIQDKPTRLSDFKGKLVLLDFWGSWCGPCRMSNPHLREMYNAYQPQGFEIVAVAHERGGSLQQQQEKWRKAVEEDRMNWVNLLNNDGQHPEDVAKLYGVTAFPTKLLIGKDGKIIKRFVGNTPLKQQELEELVKDRLK